MFSRMNNRDAFGYQKQYHGAKESGLRDSLLLPGTVFYINAKYGFDERINALTPTNTNEVTVSDDKAFVFPSARTSRLEYNTANLPSLDFGTGDFEVEIKFNAGATQGSYPTLLSNDDNWGSGIFNPRVQGWKAGLYWNPGDPLIRPNTPALVAGTTYVYTIKRVSGVVTLYLDGAPIGQVNSSNQANFSSQDSKVIVGYGPYSSNGSSAGFYGNIYYVRIRAL